MMDWIDQEDDRKKQQQLLKEKELAAAELNKLHIKKRTELLSMRYKKISELINETNCMLKDANFEAKIANHDNYHVKISAASIDGTTWEGFNSGYFTVGGYDEDTADIRFVTGRSDSSGHVSNIDFNRLSSAHVITMIGILTERIDVEFNGRYWNIEPHFKGLVPFKWPIFKIIFAIIVALVLMFQCSK